MVSAVTPKDGLARLLSAIAIVVSLIALWSGHRTFNRQEVDAKIYRDLKTLEVSILPSADSSGYSVGIRFENVGTLPITINQVEIHFDAGYASERATEKCGDDFLGNYSNAEEKFPISLQPVQRERVSFKVKWPQGCPSWIADIPLMVSYFGSDGFGRPFHVIEPAVTVKNNQKRTEDE
jgi:hypothetical protein